MMPTVLLLTRDNKIIELVNSIKLKNLRVAILKDEKFFKSYFQEFIPEFIIISSDIPDISGILSYALDSQETGIIITGPASNEDQDHIRSLKAEIKRNRRNSAPLLLEGATGPEDYKRILNILDEIEITNDSTRLLKKEMFYTGTGLKFVNQHIISLFSMQGGTGKTTLAFNIAMYLSKIKYSKVLLIDMCFSEGPSDLSLKLKLTQYPNLGFFIDNSDDLNNDFKQSLISMENINLDILFPPLSLVQSDRFDIKMLHTLIYNARNRYNYIVMDLPNRFDNIYIEMLNISTFVVFMSGLDPSQALRPEKFLKFLVPEQKKGLVFSEITNSLNYTDREFETVSSLPLIGIIPFLEKQQRKYIKTGRQKTGILDLQDHAGKIIKNIICS